MTKHTPGPWRIGDAGHTVFGPPNPPFSVPPEIVASGLTRANARLIAAAPELADALRLVQHTLDNGGTWSDVVEDVDSLLARLDAEAGK